MQVYLITNLATGKYYVGKTVSANLNRYLSVKRWAARHGQVKGMPIVASMAKHGIESFVTQTLAQAESAEQLDMLERLWIAALDALNPNVGYNISAGGGGSRRSCSLATKRKIGLANKGRKPKGYIRTEKHRQQRREAMLGNNIGVKITAARAKAWSDKMTPEQRRARSKKAAEVRWGG
jgi:group I intron endonuclease